jgi:hypothetical protein
MDKQSVQKSSHDRRSRAREFIVGDRVLARNYRPGPDWIPGTIVEVLGPVTYTVETEDGGQRWKRHIDQLKDWLAPTSSDNSRSQPETHREQNEQFFLILLTQVLLSLLQIQILRSQRLLKLPNLNTLILLLLLRSLPKAVLRLLRTDILPATDNHQTTTMH